MQFYVYHIKSPLLRSYVQYILFIYSREKSYSGVNSSFANTNCCLGILKEKYLYKKENGEMELLEKKGINSYITGIYLEPFRLFSSGLRDEICIDFTPLGFYHFFRFPVGTFMLNDDILSEAFGDCAMDFFENIFKELNSEKRGLKIELFLKTKLFDFSHHEVSEALSVIHKSGGSIRFEKLTKECRCSEKKLYRLFKSYFNISPKQYIRVVRFRKALMQLNNNGSTKLSSLAYDLGFTDQCHFIKEMKYFTGTTPKKAQNIIHSIQDTVWMSIH